MQTLLVSLIKVLLPPLLGCSAKKKQRFLSQLIQSFQRDMYNETHGMPYVEFSWHRQEGQNRYQLPSQLEASKWKFAKLDFSKNGILERKEWREFRKEWKPSTNANKEARSSRDPFNPFAYTYHQSSPGKVTKRLRKCYRNFLRFCDANNDRKVTSEEWLECTGTHDRGMALQLHVLHVFLIGIRIAKP